MAKDQKIRKVDLSVIPSHCALAEYKYTSCRLYAVVRVAKLVADWAVVSLANPGSWVGTDIEDWNSMDGMCGVERS